MAELCTSKGPVLFLLRNAETTKEASDNGKENGNYRDYRDCNRVYIGAIMG